MKQYRINSKGWLKIPVVLLLAATVSCNEEEETDSRGNIPVSFQAGIVATRTADGESAWQQGDAVGVFMLPAGGTLPSGTAFADNVRLTVTDPAIGTLSGTPIYYPQSGNVDFIAYYPYGDAGTATGNVTTDYKYAISVADQSDPARIDVLYAKAVNKARSKDAVALSFRHVLSRVTLKVKGERIAPENISELTAENLVFYGMPTAAEMDLQEGYLIAGVPDAAGFSPWKETLVPMDFQAVFSALLIPQTGMNGRRLVFMIGDREYTWTIPNDAAFDGGCHYVYPVTVRETLVEVGVPTIGVWEQNTHTDSGTVTEIVQGM